MLSGLVYLLTLDRCYWGDGLAYAIDAEAGKDLFFSHHPLYTAEGFVLLRIARLFFPGARSAPVMSAMNAVAGGVLVALVCSTARRVMSARSAVAASLMVAFSFAVWRYSTTVAVYVIPLALWGVILLVALDEPIGPRGVAVASCLLVWANLQIQLSVVMALVVPSVWMARSAKEGMPLRSSLKATACFWMCAGVLSLCAYAAIAVVAGADSLEKLWTWLTYYAQKGSWGRLSFDWLALAPAGLMRAFVNASPVRAVAAGSRCGVSAGVYMTFAALLFVALAFLTVRLTRWLFGALRDPVVIGLTVWMLAGGVFALWWFPSAVMFWTFALPPAVVLLGAAAGGSKSGHMALTAAPLLLFTLNLAGDILPSTDPERCEVRRVAVVLHENGASERDLVLTMAHVASWSYYMYGTSLRTSSLSLVADEAGGVEEGMRLMRSRVEGTFAAGGRVFLDGGEREPSPALAAPFRAVPRGRFVDFYSAYDGRLDTLAEIVSFGKDTYLFEVKQRAEVVNQDDGG